MLDKGGRLRGTAAQPSNTGVRASCGSAKGIREPTSLQNEQSECRGYGERQGRVSRGTGPGHRQRWRLFVVRYHW